MKELLITTGVAKLLFISRKRIKKKDDKIPPDKLKKKGTLRFLFILVFFLKLH